MTERKRKGTKMNIRDKIQTLGYDTELTRPQIDFKITTGKVALDNVPEKLVRACNGPKGTSPWFNTWSQVYSWVKI